MSIPKGGITYLKPDLKICRILNGMWQVSGAHGNIKKKEAIKSMGLFIDNGFITWDLADHYGPAEDYVKEFVDFRINSGLQDTLNDVKFLTKWVPRPQKITKRVVKDAVDISRKRMGMETLDMVQFHWWNYQNDNYLKALEYLDELREENIIKYLGLTNFDAEHLEEILKMGINIVSNQVQYSIIDTRPERLMAKVCKKYDLKLLVYGTLGGGLFSERYLNKLEPSGRQLYTASLYKYKDMIDRWGKWSLFQDLLQKLKNIAKKYNVSIANVAVRYVLENPIVAGVIIGVRLGISEHIKENLEVFNFALDDNDRDQINSVLKNSRDLMEIIGDCGDEYR
jgi:aryl-alcohol dehydrogenase-like predicted oxidoreductase